MAAFPDGEVSAMTVHKFETPTQDGEIALGISLGEFLPYLLNRIVNRLNVNLASDLKEIGVPIQFYRVLAVLAAGQSRSVNELSVYTITEQSTLSKMLGRMEAAGLIERVPSPEDRRVVMVEMTERGRAAYEEILPVALNHYRRAIEGLDEKQHRALLNGLRHVLENVRASPFP
jgi:DNA-binding MarR family transcriptional regulator